MTPAGAIDAIVVTYQSASTIDDCLQRLREASGIATIRVVDNASSDDTLAIVQRHAVADGRVRFIANPDNPGFAVACNQGARGGQAAWIAFVNPDCLVERDSLAALHALALPRGDALIGADLVDEAGVRDVSARRCEPDFGAMLRRAFYIGRGAASREALAVTRDADAAVQVVDAVSGALMLMPRTLFERIGGFDEGYRLHAEDLDLCRRVRDAGGEVAVANAISVLHVRGVSSRSRPLFVEWHKHRGLWRYFRRFEAARHGTALQLAVFGAIWLRFPVAAVRAWLRSRQSA